MTSAPFVITETDEYSRELLVYTAADPEQMVYIEEQAEQITDEEYALTPRAAGDITMYIDGEVRRNYNTVGLNETREARIEVEGETIQKIEWSSADTSIVSISGNKDGAAFKAISEGVTTITAKIVTDAGNREKSLIVTARSSLSITGYANVDAEMHQAANEESNVNGDIFKGDKLDVRGQTGKYFWIYHDEAYGFVLKSKVDIPAVSLSLPESVAITQGQTYQLKAEVLPEQTTDKGVVWSSANNSTVKVDKNGKITGVKKGTAYIKVKTTDGKLSADCKVEVSEIEMKNSPSKIRYGYIKPDYESMKIKFMITENVDRYFKYYFEIIDANNTKKVINSKERDSFTNEWRAVTVKGLQYNKKYIVNLILTYPDNGEKYRFPVGTEKTKKPKVKLSINKQGTNYVQLKMKATPQKSYDSYQIRYKLQGKKYTTLSKKTYSKKGNLIKVNKKIPIGKMSYFELSLYKKGKLLCKDTVKVKKGYTTVTTKIDRNLTKITVNWEKVHFAKGYEIYRSENKNKLGKKIKTLKKTSTTSYIDRTGKLKNPKKYYYQVRPYWKENKKKKTGSSNQSGIQARKIDITVNNNVLKNKMGLKDLLAGGGTNINQFYITSENGIIFPAIKYQFDGKKLTIHLYIEYRSYTFKGSYYVPSGNLVLGDEPISVILGKRNKNGKSYVNMFEQGLIKYLGNQFVKGSSDDFGKNVNFKTSLVIHRKDKKENYNSNQKFIEVMIGGISKYSYPTIDKLSQSMM